MHLKVYCSFPHFHHLCSSWFFDLWNCQVPCGTERTQRPPRCSKLCTIPRRCSHGLDCKVWPVWILFTKASVCLKYPLTAINLSQSQLLAFLHLKIRQQIRNLVCKASPGSLILLCFFISLHLLLFALASVILTRCQTCLTIAHNLMSCFPVQPHKCHYGACPACQLPCKAPLPCGHSCQERYVLVSGSTSLMKMLSISWELWRLHFITIKSDLMNICQLMLLSVLIPSPKQCVLVAQVFDVQVPWTSTTSKSRVHFQEVKEESCTRLSLKCHWRTLPTLFWTHREEMCRSTLRQWTNSRF